MKIYTEKLYKLYMEWVDKVPDEKSIFTPKEIVNAISNIIESNPSLIELSSWISIIDSLPNPLQTVWISNGKGWTTLGCISEAEEGDDGRFYWHWCETNGVIYQENGEIVSECEGNDLDVLFWHPLPKPIFNQNK